MQDAFISWTHEPHLSIEQLSSMHGLNRRFLDLASKGVSWSGRDTQVARLSPLQRDAAADCPYALFDLHFQDEAFWRARLQSVSAWSVADAPRADNELVDFVRLALFYTWHLASSANFAAHLLFGMQDTTAGALRRVPVDALPSLALSEVVNLAPRWNHCNAYWTALLGAAARSDPTALRRVQLSGLQLAAACQLPSEPREV